MGQPAARGSARGDGAARSEDRLTGPSSARSGGEGSERTVVDDAAGRGAGDLPGVRADNGRRDSLCAGQAGGELLGADSARVQFGRASAAGIDQQTGEPVHEDVVGGSGASGRALRSADEAGIFASLSSKAE